ncbi:MAG: iron chelate uptake ABC transporter family permease subunit [Actinomycetota bacterium]
MAIPGRSVRGDVRIAHGFPGISGSGWRLDLLGVGDEDAKTLGISVGGTRLGVVIAVMLETTAVVSVSGLIRGFPPS